MQWGKTGVGVDIILGDTSVGKACASANELVRFRLGTSNLPDNQTRKITTRTNKTVDFYIGTTLIGENCPMYDVAFDGIYHTYFNVASAVATKNLIAIYLLSKK